MRYSVFAMAVALGACSLDAPVEPIRPWVPTNPLAVILATEGATYALTQLGSQTSPPLLTWDAVCGGLRYRNEFADTIFFKGDRSYSRVYRYRTNSWRTIGVSEPQPRRGHYSFEQTGMLYGEGDLLQLSHSIKSDALSKFEIRGAALVRHERIGIGCRGEGNMVEAAYTRVSE